MSDHDQPRWTVDDATLVLHGRRRAGEPDTLYFSIPFLSQITSREYDALVAAVRDADTLRQAHELADKRTLTAAVNALECCATDEREPERYRTWYAEAAVRITAVLDLLALVHDIGDET